MILYNFQNGVVIIDSPGVGESPEMDEMVIQYLPNALAFIYVINCTNAGGIQKDRVSIYRALQVRKIKTSHDYIFVRLFFIVNQSANRSKNATNLFNG